MVATTITKEPSGRRISLISGYLAFSFISIFLIFTNILSADSRPGSTAERNAACAASRLQLRLGNALEKDFALQALATCPVDDGQTARLLEQTIENGDFRHRLMALKALDRHLDPASVNFLIETYYRPNLRQNERVLVFEYLSREATGRWKSRLRRIFQEGIGDESRRIRLASVLGLGRIGADEDWNEYLAPLATNADADLLRNLLVAARLLRTSAALELGEQYLRDPRPPIALAAIELLAVLPGPRARESLLLLDFYRLPDDEPSPRQLGAILARAESKTPPAEKSNTRNSGVTLRRSRLFAAPHDRSAVLGALAKDTILYLDTRANRDYRLRTNARSGRWYRVATSAGLRGWIHSSNLFTLPCPTCAPTAAAAP